MEHYFGSYQVRQIAITIAGLKEELGVDAHKKLVEEFTDMLVVNCQRFDPRKFRQQCHAVVKPGEGLVAVPRTTQVAWPAGPTI